MPSILQNIAQDHCIRKCGKRMNLSPNIGSSFNSTTYDALMPICVESCQKQTYDCEYICDNTNTYAKPRLACAAGCSIGRSMLVDNA